MQSKASTVAAYLKGLPDDRRKAITAFCALNRNKSGVMAEAVAS